MYHRERGQSAQEKPVPSPAEAYCSVRHHTGQGLNANSSNVPCIAIYLNVVSMTRGRTGHTDEIRQSASLGELTL